MSFISEKKRRCPFFEGWYFKQRSGDNVLAVIPGVSSDEIGHNGAFVQVIWNEGSRYVPYSMDAFHADRDTRTIMVGDSVFSPDGVMLDVQDGDFSLVGQLEYDSKRELKRSLFAPDMMGPYARLPFMECYHDVVSVRHDVTGELKLNGEHVQFNRDAGYIEKDWGRSFPSDWLWLHCNDFIVRPEATIMLSVARIPLLGRHFSGVICLIDDGLRQIRLASYYGAKCTSLSVSPDNARIIVRQGSYLLQVVIGINPGQNLHAPSEGVMSRAMTESLSCTLNVALWHGNNLLWADTGRNSGFECVGDFSLLENKSR